MTMETASVRCKPLRSIRRTSGVSRKLRSIASARGIRTSRREIERSDRDADGRECDEIWGLQPRISARHRALVRMVVLRPLSREVENSYAGGR